MASGTTEPRSDVRRADTTTPGPLPLWYSLALAAVLTSATLYGLLFDDAYRVSPGVREDFPAVMRGQDLLTLLTVPVLAWTAQRARAGSFKLHLLWLGLLMYYAYSYVMYAVSPFNDVFLLYVAVIGMAGYGLIDGLLRLDTATLAPAVAGVPRRLLAGFLIVVGVLFIGLWLSMILPAIPGGLPDGRVTYDIASAVHTLDLAIVLPLLLATGRLLLRGHVAGPVLGTVLLCKMVTLGLALLFMNLVFVDRPSAGELVVWTLIATISAGFLIVVTRRMSAPASPWMHSSIWR